MKFELFYQVFSMYIHIHNNNVMVVNGQARTTNIYEYYVLTVINYAYTKYIYDVGVCCFIYLFCVYINEDFIQY